jgi:hypothetical protein
VTGIILSNATYHDNFDNTVAFLHEYVMLNVPKAHLDSTGRGDHGGGEVTISVCVWVVDDDCVECVLEDMQGQRMVNCFEKGNVSIVMMKWQVALTYTHLTAP